jgi:hypothetical protein
LFEGLGNGPYARNNLEIQSYFVSHLVELVQQLESEPSADAVPKVLTQLRGLFHFEGITEVQRREFQNFSLRLWNVAVRRRRREDRDSAILEGFFQVNPSSQNCCGFAKFRDKE